ncbi:MAG: quinolinate synthase NadA [Candidatus Saganbacteria bacterium]|nr:quinolinate synthase NadA [Candidatus Saganbacteria bacterium]
MPVRRPQRYILTEELFSGSLGGRSRLASRWSFIREKRLLAVELSARINKFKQERNAVILAHNYQRPEVQDSADFVGDSLGLSLAASRTGAKVIVFCGVNFMAETAAIISPDKLVLMPDPNAGCPMADMITVEKLKELKVGYPGRPVVCYVNSGAAVKAESDICCTSANAVGVVRSLPDKEIIFIPDKFLGQFVQNKLPEKKLILFNGYCPTHARILPEHVARAKAAHPGAPVLVHPECRPATIAAADAALSTEGMARFVKESPAGEFLIGTETGMIYRLQKENPGKKFYPVTELAGCPNMKLTTLEKVLWSLAELKTEIKVSKEIADKARAAIARMLEVGRQD